MNIEAYDKLMELVATDAAIKEAEEEYSQNEKLFDARAELSALRRKYLGES